MELNHSSQPPSYTSTAAAPAVGASTAGSSGGDDPNRKTRSRTGCAPCRTTRVSIKALPTVPPACHYPFSRRKRPPCGALLIVQVKCDEITPVCGRCSSRQLQCVWPSVSEIAPRKQRHPRPIQSCDNCRRRKVGAPCPKTLLLTRL